MKTDKVILGVIGGLAAGALMGILFAPDKGTKTRKKIKRKSNEYVDGIKEKFDSTIDTISNKYDTLKQEGLNLLNDGKSKFEKTRKEIENLEV
mgnify:FL=1